MMDVRFYKDEKGEETLEVSERGLDILKNSISNRGSAFTEEEREKFGLHGLLPADVSSIEIQVERAYSEFQQIGSELGKHVFLRALQDRNEVLFYLLMQHYITEMMPIVYTPTVGLACQQFSRIYRVPRGLFISYEQIDHMDTILSHTPYQNVEVIVATDGERILGLGDLGVGGMGIPVGKLALYTLCGGLHPSTTLPILLDPGTDNEEKLADPLYLGARHKRIRGKQYDDFIEAFVKAVMKRWPNVLLQWEDFGRNQARSILERYRDQLCTFNDDIQGTAAVTIAGIMAAVKAIKSQMKDQRVLIFGAGAAGIGIADEICAVLKRLGLSEKEAKEHLFLVDKEGLIHEGCSHIEEFQVKYTLSKERLRVLGAEDKAKYDLEEAITLVKPTILIGTSATHGAFTESVIRKMSTYAHRPIIFPLSNPTSKCEADPSDLIKWTEGRAIIATGSPFANVSYDERLIPIGQCNNSYIFPGLGLGVVASKARRVTDSMFFAAANTLSDCSPMLGNPHASLYPSLESIRLVSRKIAIAVGREAQAAGVAEKTTAEELVRRVDDKMWKPAYPKIRYNPNLRK